MRRIVIRRKGRGSYIARTPADATAFLEGEVNAMLECDEFKDELRIGICEMSDGEVDSLPEFEGW